MQHRQVSEESEKILSCMEYYIFDMCIFYLNYIGKGLIICETSNADI